MLFRSEKSIVGKWKEKRSYNLANQPKWIDVDHGDDFFEFTSGGEWGLLFWKEYNFPATYTVDNSVDPHRINLTIKKDKTQLVWIYKFEGEKLIIKLSFDPKDGIPKDFEPEPKFGISEFVRK